MIQLMIGQDLATNLTISSTVTELEDKLDEDELFYRFNTVRGPTLSVPAEGTRLEAVVTMGNVAQRLAAAFAALQTWS